jgi:hypothetical protein
MLAVTNITQEGTEATDNGETTIMQESGIILLEPEVTMDVDGRNVWDREPDWEAALEVVLSHFSTEQKLFDVKDRWCACIDWRETYGPFAPKLVDLLEHEAVPRRSMVKLFQWQEAHFFIGSCFRSGGWRQAVGDFPKREYFSFHYPQSGQTVEQFIREVFAWFRQVASQRLVMSEEQKRLLSSDFALFSAAGEGLVVPAEVEIGVDANQVFSVLVDDEESWEDYIEWDRCIPPGPLFGWKTDRQADAEDEELELLAEEENQWL